ncbi:MAG: lipopolysaccharide kinase InaA family protein [Phycisphaerae bacterium]|nr:lipopolysaccharide kinase InaA family protein [Phycisphaerae bacterium]
MSRRTQVSPEWSRLFEQIGLPDAARALAESQSLDSLPGRWTALQKPGLGGRERWRWEIETEAGPRTLFVKRYFRMPLQAQWDRWLRQSAAHSRAWWEFEQARLLRAAAIAAPAAAAVAECVSFGVERWSMVCLSAARGKPFDAAWTQATLEHAPVTRGRARCELTRRLARFVAAFHQTGRTHRDLYLCHIFVELDDAGAAPPHFELIDLGRIHLPWLMRSRWIVKDLAQLDASARRIGATRTDRVRFLTTYLGLPNGRGRVRTLARAVVRKSNHILRRDARKGRGH